MSCFIVPAVEAIATTIAAKVIAKKEMNNEIHHEGGSDELIENSHFTSFSKKLGWLNNMLWGGSALLLLEHVWHGEVIASFPFLTAAANVADRAQMLREMSTVGVSMAALVTAVWGVMVLVSSRSEKRAANDQRLAEIVVENDEDAER